MPSNVIEWVKPKKRKPFGEKPDKYEKELETPPVPQDYSKIALLLLALVLLFASLYNYGLFR